jgi:riboflavin transporter FmnP
MSTALMVLTQIPMFGGFMKLDFSILPILVSLYILGLRSSLSILLLRSILKLLFFSEGISTIIGIPMNIIAMSVFIMCIGYFQRKNSSFHLKKFILGGGLGTLFSTGVMLILNIIYALPLYEKFMNFHLEKMGMSTKEWILAMVIPFNLIQGILLTISGSLLLTALLPIIHQYNRFT